MNYHRGCSHKRFPGGFPGAPQGWDAVKTPDRSITKPIAEIEIAANLMAEENLHVTVSHTSDDELGSLANSMRTKSERIAYYMKELSDLMVQLADGGLTWRGGRLLPVISVQSKMQLAD